MLASEPPLEQTEDSVKPLAGSQRSLPLGSPPPARGHRASEIENAFRLLSPLLKGTPGLEFTKESRGHLGDHYVITGGNGSTWAMFTMHPFEAPRYLLLHSLAVAPRAH